MLWTSDLGRTDRRKDDGETDGQTDHYMAFAEQSLIKNKEN